MMEIFKALGILSIVVLCNILCGTYYNVNIKNMKFDWTKLLNGIIKAVIVGVIAVGMSFVFTEMPELTEAIGITPMVIMNSAIILYGGKAVVGLGKTWGVNVNIK